MSYAAGMTRGGRPPISPSGAADNLIRLRCTTAEKDRFARIAAASGLSLSQWMLDAARREAERQEHESTSPKRTRKKT
ncbi:MAG: hypothetical protein ACOC3G_07825 [Phycisphaeraceae bacterium]